MHPFESDYRRIVIEEDWLRRANPGSSDTSLRRQARKAEIYRGWISGLARRLNRSPEHFDALPFTNS